MGKLLAILNDRPGTWPSPDTVTGQSIRHGVYKDGLKMAMKDLQNFGASCRLTQSEMVSVGQVLWMAYQMLEDIEQLRKDQLRLRTQLMEAERLSPAFIDRAIVHLDPDR